MSKVFMRVQNLLISIFLALSCLLLVTPVGAEPRAKINVITIDDAVINPVIEEYIATAIDFSEAEMADCLIIELDTPGGLLQSTRVIVKDIMNAQIPVVVYVGPSGARAGSAGVFITLAAHVAGMAPSTNIGAAHPVDLGGGDPDSKKDLTRAVMKFLKKEQAPAPGSENDAAEEETAPESATVLDHKILNDTTAWMRTIAQMRGRNEEWAVAAVTESVSQTEEEARDLGVIDFVATDLQDVIAHLDGRTVSIREGVTTVLSLENAEITMMPMSVRQKMLRAISHPNIAYILMMLGFYGLLFEVTHPGIGFPGIAGAICLILAFYSLSTLPVNYAGLSLLVLGIILFIAEVNVVSFGLLTLGGLVCFSLGSLFLVDSGLPFLQVSLSLIVPVVIVTAVITLVLVSAVVRVHKKKSLVGKEGLVGSRGHADVDFESGKGTVKVHGEIWQAVSDDAIRAGDAVVVDVIDGLVLHVKKHI